MARLAVALGCEFVTHTDVDEGVLEEWCGECYVCQIAEAVDGGRI
jgi:hypothetical protein